MYVAKTKALISFAVTAKLICVFVFAYAKCWFSRDAAHFSNISHLDFEDRSSVLILPVPGYCLFGTQVFVLPRQHLI